MQVQELVAQYCAMQTQSLPDFASCEWPLYINFITVLQKFEEKLLIVVN